MGRGQNRKPVRPHRQPYPGDLTDEQWAGVEPLIPPARPGGRPGKADLREVLNALFYRAR